MSAMFSKFVFTPHVIAAFVISLSAFAAAPDDQPEKQVEADWVDARWNRTDLGNFHSSLLRLPDGTIAKGLSVRVGAQGEAALAYDTATCSLRAGWTGGFLKFTARRYGLIDTPQPGGPLLFNMSAKPSWGKSSVQWHGLHVNGPRVVLEYTVDGALVRETPWMRTQRIDERSSLHFSRELEIGPHEHELNLLLLETPNPSLGAKSAGGVYYVLHTNRQDITTVGLARGSGANDLPELYTDNQRNLWARFARSTKATSCELLVWSGSSLLLPDVTEFVVDAKPANDLLKLLPPGPSRWTPLTTRGQRGFGNDAYVIDTVTVPYDNPWKALFFTAGVDFLPNGDAAVCTIHGDVWLVSGINDGLQKITWRRFATGLFQPLGLRVREGRIHVLGRDQIAVLHDENGDGEADFYENFCNQIQTSIGGHEYVTSLETDTNGNFYYVDPRGVHCVSPDGKKVETIAAGFRNPNGMGVSPDGSTITVAPQQGERTPSSVIVEAQPGGWYGYAGPHVTAERPLGYDAPLCWIPHRVDNSSGSQLWVSSERWGPLRDHFLHFSFGRCAEFLVLREVVDGVPQGALAPLPGKFLSGAMRGAFNPRDGQLYVVGSRGWQTSAVRDGCLQRVRYTGTTPLVPLEFHVHTNGLRLIFTTTLDRSAAEDTGSYAVAHWNYRYAAQYGSKDYLPSDPGKEGHEPLEVRSAKLLPDGRGVFLEIPGLRPVMQWELRYSLKTVDGKNLRSGLHGSINRLGKRWEP